MNLPQPLCPEVGVVGLVPDQWGPHWQPRHFVLSRLATYFNVVWMNCPPAWRNYFSAMHQRGAVLRQAPAAPAGLQIYHPEAWLPMFGRPSWLARFTSRERLRRACALLRERGCTKLVFYIWRPEFANALGLAPHDLSIYHVDDDYSFSSTEVQVSFAEQRLLESVDQVFIHSPALIEKRGSFNPNTKFIPNGVDYRMYSTPAPEPEDLAAIPHPRVGYVGYLKRMLDLPLLLELSARHSHWSFVLVGPPRPHPDVFHSIQQLSRRPNVHFLGPKPVERLPNYPQHFDVCIMPYKLDDYTKYIYPLKMHEYLASGRPVVSTPIRSVQAFSHVIGLATDVEEWSLSIDRALSEAENAPARKAERQAVAREHDWNSLVLCIARTIAEQLHISTTSSRLNEHFHSLSSSLPLSLTSWELAGSRDTL